MRSGLYEDLHAQTCGLVIRPDLAVAVPCRHLERSSISAASNRIYCPAYILEG